MSVRHKYSQCREKMATVAFRKWNLAVCKKMSCISTPGFLTLCTSKGSFMSKAAYSTTSCVHNSGHKQASTGRSYLQRVCDVCPKGRLYLHVWTPLSLSHRPDRAKLLSSPSVLLVESCRSAKGPMPRGGQILKPDLLLTSVSALTRFTCLIRSSFTALFMSKLGNDKLFTLELLRLMRW